MIEITRKHNANSDKLKLDEPDIKTFIYMQSNSFSGFDGVRNKLLKLEEKKVSHARIMLSS